MYAQRYIASGRVFAIILRKYIQAFTKRAAYSEAVKHVVAFAADEASFKATSF